MALPGANETHRLSPVRCRTKNWRCVASTSTRQKPRTRVRSTLTPSPPRPLPGRPPYLRHYPALIPLELSSFLSELATALRKERHKPLAWAKLGAADADIAVDGQIAMDAELADTDGCHVPTVWGGIVTYSSVAVVSGFLGFYMSSARRIRSMPSA